MPGVKGIHGRHPNTLKSLLGNQPGNRTGIKDKSTRLRDVLFSSHKILERLNTGEWLEPLELLMGWANDKKLAIPVRLEAAKCAALYMHRKAPVQVDIKDEAHNPLDDIPTEELLKALQLLTADNQDIRSVKSQLFPMTLTAP